MIRARVLVDPNRVDRMDEEMKKRARVAVESAARAAATVANGRYPDGNFHAKPARGTHDGVAAGVGGNPLAHIFNKGSLGRHVGALKRDRRKDSWPVRRGAGYTATRQPEALTGNTGVAARDIFGPARRAGRKALQAALRRR